MLKDRLALAAITPPSPRTPLSPLSDVRPDINSNINGLHVAGNHKVKTKTSEPLPGVRPTGEDPSNPHELIGWVEKILGKLESNYDEMSSQFLDKLSTLANRVDSLERSIQDLTQGAAATLSGDADASFPPVVAEQGD